MPDNFDNLSRTNIDVRRIPNYLILARNKKARKAYPLIFHILYSLAAALCIYFAVDGACIGLSPLDVVGVCLGPAMLVYTFLYSPVWIKCGSVILPALIYVARHLISEGSLSFMHGVNHCLIYILCILVSAALAKTAISGYSKSKSFLLVTCCYVAVILCSLAILVIYHKGTLGLSAIKEAVDSFFAAVVDTSAENFSAPEALSIIREGIVAAKDLTDEELIGILRESFEISASYVKTLIPSIIAVIGMIFSFVTVEVFSRIARRMKIDLFVCVMDDVWTYRPSTVTAAFFDIVFLAYIIGTLVSFPANIAITVENLMNIMMPVMFVVGAKAIYNFFFKKNKSKGKSIAICVGIFILVLGFTGSLGMLIIGSFGVTLMTLRDREEAELLPSRMSEQKEECEKLFPGENKNSDHPFDDTKSD